MIATRFGKNLLTARKRAGLSQEGLALAASIHRTEISLLERGERTPRIDTVLKLAGTLGVPVAELTAGIEWSPGHVERGQFEAATTGGSEEGR